MIPERFKVYILNNWRMKIGSLAASFILYGYIQYTRNIKRTLHVKVERPELTQGLMFASRIPSFLNVEMSGSKEINNFDSSEFKIILRLSNPPAKPGKENLYRAQITPEFPNGIQVDYKTEMTVLLDKKIIRELPILPQIQAALGQGQKLGYVKVDPATVRLVGPEHILKDMEQMGTKPVEILNESIIQKETQLFGLPNFVSLAKNEGELVKVSAVVIDANASNTYKVEGIPVKCANVIPGLKLEVLGSGFVSIVIVADETTVLPEEFEAEVFCPVYYDYKVKQIQPGFHIKNKPVMVRDLKNRLDIQIVKVVPSQVSLQFEKNPNFVPGKNTRRQAFKEHLLIQP